MVQVIKKYFDEPKQIECNQCRDTLEYIYEDLRISYYNEHNIYIQCPTCGIRNNLHNRTNSSFINYFYKKLNEEKN